MLGRRKWIAALTIVAAALVSVLGLWFQGRTPRGSQPQRVAPARVATGLASSVMPPHEKSAKRAPATAQTGSAPLPTAGKNGEVEVCGIGVVKLETGDPLVDPVVASQEVRSLAQSADARWRSALLSSDDPRARAVGLFLDAQVGELSLRTTGVNGGREQARDALVELALETRDPAVYGIATQICRRDSGAPADGACKRISLNEWTRIDPDNAVPWLLLAAAEREKNDIASEVEAFHRAAKAHKIDSYGYSLYEFAHADLPMDLTPLQKLLLAQEIIGYESAWAVPWHTLLQRCSKESLQDASVKETCSALAELLVTRGTTLIDFSLGRRLGESAGWPRDRVSAIAQERDALMQVGLSVDNGSSWSCKNVERVNTYLDEVARVGELEAMREVLAQSGEAARDLAEKHAAEEGEMMRAQRKQEGTSTAPVP